MKRRIFAIGMCLLAATLHAAPLIVIDARGGSLKPGQKIDSAKPITLKDGERVTLIAPDGRSVTLRGRYAGPPMAPGAASADPRQALAALISTRGARTSSVGVVRGGAEAQPLPEPWLIDVSRSGERCLRAGTTPIWWRPTKTAPQPFTVFPIDRSWRADFTWRTKQDKMAMPALGKFEGQTMFVIRNPDQEYVIDVNLIPPAVDTDVVLASWMLEKGCTQQADALLRQLQAQGAARPAQP